MDLTVFLAVLVAAALHAGWNAHIKSGGDPFLNVAHMSFAAIFVSGVLINFVSFPIAAAWPWLIGSVVLHAGYRFALIAAYKSGDLGQVYPIARGAAPLMTAVITATLIGERLSLYGYAGILLLAAGVFLMSFRGGRLGELNRRGVGFALQTACWTAAYSVVDGVGARVNGSGPSFVIWMFFLSALTMVVCALIARGPRELLMVRDRWPLVLAAVMMSEGAYFIAVWAMTQAPIALVAALRETSVLFAAILSVVLLGEPLTGWRVLAGLLVVAGVVMMRLA